MREKPAKDTFWGKASGLYDFFEKLYNPKVYRGMGARAAAYLPPDAAVLDCACGTGAISAALAPACASLVASDFSPGMLEQARKNLAAFSNVTFRQADIMALPFEDSAFDAVVAGNILHILPDPAGAVRELFRVCRPGGRVILPTYINDAGKKSRLAVRFLEALGADFSRQFDAASYEAFFASLGFPGAVREIVPGRMPCAIAVLTPEKGSVPVT